MKKIDSKLLKKVLIASVVAAVAANCALLCIAIWFVIRSGQPIPLGEILVEQLPGVFELACQWLSLLMTVLLTASFYFGNRLTFYGCLTLGVLCAHFQFMYGSYKSVELYGGFWQSLSIGMKSGLIPHMATCVVYATTFWLVWSVGRDRARTT